MKSPRTPGRSRDRGPKSPLSRDAVIQAALECLKAGGPNGLTMRGVAALLETGPGSLYVYVRDQRELSILVLDAIAAEVARPTPGPDPSARLVALLMDYARCLFTYPGGARLALANPPTGPRYLDLLEASLALLVAQGLGIGHAALAADALFLLVTAAMAEQDARRWEDPGVSVGELYAEAIDGQEQDMRPLVSAARPEAFALGGEERLEWIVRALLGGLISAPPFPPPASRTSTPKEGS